MTATVVTTVAAKRQRSFDEDSDESEDEGRYTKYVRLSSEELREIVSTAEEVGAIPDIFCTLTATCASLPPFHTIAEYERHYEETHTRVCSQCRRILPTAHLLDLHLMEVHDSFFQVAAEKQKMYACFVEDCKKKFSSPHTRRLHMVDKHGFSRKYNFNVILGESSSRVKPKRQQPKAQPSQRRLNPSAKPNTGSADGSSLQDTENNAHDPNAMDVLSESFSRLSVPSNITFGRRAEKKTISAETVKRMHEAHAPATFVQKQSEEERCHIIRKQEMKSAKQAKSGQSEQM